MCGIEGESAGNLLPVLAAIVGSVVISLSIFLSYAFADRLAQVLGSTAMSVIMRLSSFLLVCIGVQILWNGSPPWIRTTVYGSCFMPSRSRAAGTGRAGGHNGTLGTSIGGACVANFPARRDAMPHRRPA